MYRGEVLIQQSLNFLEDGINISSIKLRFLSYFGKPHQASTLRF